MISGRTPLAVFAYNRPQHLSRALESLASCERFNDCLLHIFVDGPKTPQDDSAVDECRQLANQTGARFGALVSARETNVGLQQSIVAAVTDLCARYGRVIVVEDDLFLHPQFLTFMLASLERYLDVDQVYQVSGFMFPIDNPEKPNAMFLSIASTWGWATWQRAWKAFDWDVPGAKQDLADPDFRRDFDLNGAYPYAEMLEQRLAGQNNSWGILWYYRLMKAQGLVLYPSRTLVRNEGFDGSGTHGGARTAVEADQADWGDFRKSVLPDSIVFPATLSIDRMAMRRIEDFLNRKERVGILKRLVQKFRNQMNPPQ